jgi:cytochrome c oxidase cbb3-type subunit 3
MSDKKIDELKNTEYDGIQEYDNDLPRWWVITFVLCLVFGAGYWIYHRNFDAPDQIERYDETLTAHQNKYLKDVNKNLTNESLLAMVNVPSDVDAGKAIYTNNCVACHADNLGGGIGPNLTDAYWIHGAQPLDIHRTIQEGVVEKGMLSWQGILTSKQMEQVTAYVLTFKNTNVDGGKEPQGELVE